MYFVVWIKGDDLKWASNHHHTNNKSSPSHSSISNSKLVWGYNEIQKKNIYLQNDFWCIQSEGQNSKIYQALHVPWYLRTWNRLCWTIWNTEQLETTFTLWYFLEMYTDGSVCGLYLNSPAVTSHIERVETTMKGRKEGRETERMAKRSEKGG